MGNILSGKKLIPVNYYCSVCMESGKSRNIIERFHIVDDIYYECNGCKTIYDKNNFLNKRNSANIIIPA